jgi:hypothetical protein
MITVKELRKALRGVGGSVEVHFHEGRPGGVFPPKHHHILIAEATEGAYLGDGSKVFILYGEASIAHRHGEV